jgi:hypothetical protein
LAAVASVSCNWSVTEMSQGRYSGRLPVAASISSQKAVPSERWQKATFAPWRRKASVSAAPMPEPPPVMKTERP